MLYNLNWLEPGSTFPPQSEKDRVTRYRQNAQLFDGDHFADPGFRAHDKDSSNTVNLYLQCAKRISRVIGNFEDVVSFPTLLNYQRLMTLKIADLVCGEYPTISGATPAENEAIRDIRDYADFDSKLFSTVIDLSRYGDAIWRLYKDDGRLNFTCWEPSQWYPIVTQDGTNTITHHCLCWRENRSGSPLVGDWYLMVQIHACGKDGIGKYTQREYKMNQDGTVIEDLLTDMDVLTGLDRCAVMSLKAYTVTNSIYGYDDYVPIDSILAEIMTRIGQISVILDKHADPCLVGPVSMLTLNQETGEYSLNAGKFYGLSQGDERPEYLTWDGQLSSAFHELEFLINQLYILSEMGSALLGSGDGTGQAISGAAMRFKMVNPLAKARRISNSLTRAVRQLFSSLSADVDLNSIEDTGNLELPIPYRKISVFWADGLPDDPRENIENCKLATGATHLMPLEKGIMEFFNRSNEEAQQWVEALKKAAEESVLMAQHRDPNHPGPQDGTGVNSAAKGSKTGLNNFKSPTNKDKHEQEV